MTDPGAPQSGLSQQPDFDASRRRFLRAYGDISVKDSVRNVLERDCGGATGRLWPSTRSGLDEFDITNFATEANDAKSLLALGIQSPTLTKQIQKRVALKYLCDVRQEIKNKIAEEIDGFHRLKLVLKASAQAKNAHSTNSPVE